MPLVTSDVGIFFLPQGHNLNKFKGGPLEDATYQISQLLRFQRRLICFLYKYKSM